MDFLYTFRKHISLLTLLFFLGGGIPAFAAADDSWVSVNADSPVSGAGLGSHIYSVDMEKSEIREITLQENAKELHSLVNREAEDTLIKGLTRLEKRENISVNPLTDILQATDRIRLQGNTLSTVANTIGYQSFTMSENCGVQVLADSQQAANGTDAADAYIYVVDKDATCFVVVDEEGMGIGDALVTISYLDDNGNRITRAAKTTNTGVKGVVAFKGIDGSYFATLDIAAEHYRAKTIFSAMITGGQKYTYGLERCDTNAVYLRGADLDGSDVVNSPTEIDLLEQGTQPIDFSVLITAPNGVLPDTVDLYATNRNALVATFTNPTDYEIGVGKEATYLFTLSKDWIGQNKGLLKEGDRLELRFGTQREALPGITVENAVYVPRADEAELPVTPQGLEYSKDDFYRAEGTSSNDSSWVDALAGSGLFSGGLKAAGVKVSIGYFPDGGCVITVSKDIEKWKEKWDTLFPNTWKPSTKDGFKNLFAPYSEAFWDNVEYVNSGNVHFLGDHVIMTGNSYGEFNFNVSGLVQAKYNKYTDMQEGTIAFVVSAQEKQGYTEYFLVTLGPVFFPAYLGGETGATANGTLEGNVQWEKDKLTETFQMGSNGPVDVRFDVLPFLTAYVGTGLRGMLSAEVDGNITFDIALLIRPFAPNKLPLHTLIDFGASVKALFNAWIFNAHIDIAKTGWIRLSDSDSPQLASTIAEEVADVQWAVRDFSGSSENATIKTPQEVLQNNNRVTTRLAEFTYTVDGNTKGSNDPYSQLVDDSTYSDPQIQVIAANTVNPTLFRIISEDGHTRLVYQNKSNGQGRYTREYTRVVMPEDADVLEYKVVCSEDKKRAYIAAVCGNNDITDPAEQMNQMFLAGIVIDLSSGKEIACKRMTTEPGYYLFQPMPACYDGTDPEHFGDITAGYKRAKIDSDKLKSAANAGDYVSALLQKAQQAENIMVGLNETPYTMGTGDFYCTGHYKDEADPVFWAVKEETANEVTLRARNALGRTSDSNPAFTLRLDVSQYKRSHENEPYISDWISLDGVNYVIACGKLYYLAKMESGEYRFVPAKGNNELINGESVYTMVENSSPNMLNLVSLRNHYDLRDNNNDPDNRPTADKNGVDLTVYTVSIEDGSDGGKVVTMHGPLEYHIAAPDITSYTFAYHETEPKGMSVIYTAKGNHDDVADIWQWFQNEEEGILLKKVTLPSQTVTTADEVVGAVLELQNVGVDRQQSVTVTVTSYDSENHPTELIQLVDSSDGWIQRSDNQYEADLWTGDTKALSVYFRPDANWQEDREYHLVFEVKDQQGNLLTSTREEHYANGSTYTHTIGNDSVLHMRGRVQIVNGEHVAELSVCNDSYYGSEQPQIQIVGVPANAANASLQEEKVIKTHQLGTGIRSTGTDKTQAVAYNFTVNLEQAFRDAAKEGMGSVKVYLTGQNDNPLNHAVVELKNPYYTYNGKTQPVDPGYDYSGGSGSAGITAKPAFVMTIGSKSAEVFGKRALWDVAPIIRDERTFTPVRFVAEALGAKVDWNEAKQTITITKGKTTIVLTIGSRVATVNGKPVQMDVAPFIENSRTYTPSRFVAEQLGANVEWNEKTRQVIIRMI